MQPDPNITICLVSGDTHSYDPPQKQVDAQGRGRDKEARARPEAGGRGQDRCLCPGEKSAYTQFLPPRPGHFSLGPGTRRQAGGRAGGWTGGPEGEDA